MLIFYLLVNVYLVLLLWVPRWILNIHLDILLEVPLGGRCPISSRHLGTFLLFHLLYCHLFTLLYICYPFTFMFILIPFIYLSSHLHLCSSPSPLFIYHPIYIYVHPHVLYLFVIPFTFCSSSSPLFIALFISIVLYFDPLRLHDHPSR